MSESALPPVASTPKVDPETLVLRARPARVARFRRGAIVALAAGTSAAIIGVAWLALQPASLSFVAEDSSDKNLAAKAPTDALAGAPPSYGDVPKLGPPLPGDLGRPILARQREIEAGTLADPEADAAARAAQEAAAERQRILAEKKAARESAVMVPLGRNAPATIASAGETSLAPAAVAPAALPDPNGQRRKNALVGQANEGDTVNPHRLQQAASPWTLHAGTIIAASLITGINSDLPGFVTAQVTENVYDSATGQTLLLPQGARLIGNYDSVVAYGQSRALVVWQRILFPDGSSIRIDNVPATDTQGFAGLSDRIDRHSWQLLKGVVLSTLLGVGTELGAGNSDSDLVRAVRESGQQAGARAGDQIVGKSLDVQPTLTIRPGWPLRIVVHKDIVLRPWNGEGA